MKVVFVSSEIFPFIKSGGLADVSSSLPKALKKNSIDVLSIMPLYSQVDVKKHKIKTTDFVFSFWMDHQEYFFELFQKDDNYFIKSHNGLFDRDTIYGDYDDNDIRFGLFSYAVLEFLKIKDIKADIIHINDWQSALIALLAKERYHMDSKIVFTIHNLAYQGVFPKNSIYKLDLNWNYFTMHQLEFFDSVNFLKSAIAYSDAITTVSPSYAGEIQSPKYGCQLDSFLRDNSYKLRGILNGIDDDEFNPKKDKYIYENYSVKNANKKKENKRLFLKDMGLDGRKKPLFVFIGRFTYQKGVEQLLHGIHFLKDMDVNVAILGSGEEYYDNQFKELIGKYDNISITLGYNEELSRKMYAAADFLFMPSIYEPCGLNQMIAMHYGTMPIVRKTGGLRDTVVDFTDIVDIPDHIGVGVTFESEDSFTFLHAVAKAISLYANSTKFEKLVKHNMTTDFSWEFKAKEYISLYEQLINND